MQNATQTHTNMPIVPYALYDILSSSIYIGRTTKVDLFVLFVTYIDTHQAIPQKQYTIDGYALRRPIASEALRETEDY